MDGDFNFRAVAGESFVDGVVDDFVNEMVKACFTSRTDVHGGPFAHRFQTFQNFDGTGIVDIGGRQNFV